MSLQPFTPAGVTAKTAELYALSAPALNAEADAVAADFRDWIKDNFSLTSPQNTYLTGISDDAANYFGAQCSVAFRSKLTITLTVGPDPGPGSSKWLLSQDTLTVSTNSSGDLETTGTLSFKVEYRI